MIDALVRIARPRGTALAALVPWLGYGFAHWDNALATPARPLAMLPLTAGWILGSAGTMWLNARLDGAEGEALFAREAKIPPRVERYGYAALALAIALAAAAEARAGAICAVVALLSVLYSHPRAAWKTTTYLAPLISAVGYGALSALAGYVVTGAPIGARSLAAFALLALSIYGLAVGAQAFQRDDDARRGYRTFVVVRSPAECLRFAHGCVGSALFGTSALMALGVFPRACLLGVPSFWLAHRAMCAWQKKPEGGGARDAARYVGALLFGLVVLVLLALADDRLT